MVEQTSIKCAKCGVTSKDQPTLNFHRFPIPTKLSLLKARVWAMFCFPEEDWSSDESLNRLHTQHKMLCANHFDDSSYTCSNRKRLNKFALPTGAQDILSQLRDEILNASEVAQRDQKFDTEKLSQTQKPSDNLKPTDIKTPSNTKIMTYYNDGLENSDYDYEVEMLEPWSDEEDVPSQNEELVMSDDADDNSQQTEESYKDVADISDSNTMERSQFLPVTEVAEEIEIDVATDDKNDVVPDPPVVNKDNGIIPLRSSRNHVNQTPIHRTHQKLLNLSLKNLGNGNNLPALPVQCKTKDSFVKSSFGMVKKFGVVYRYANTSTVKDKWLSVVPIGHMFNDSEHECRILFNVDDYWLFKKQFRNKNEPPTKQRETDEAARAYNSICHSCLRPAAGLTKPKETFLKFHYDVSEVKVAMDVHYCAHCEYNLKKFYKFKKRCVAANRILISHKESTESNKTPVEELHKLLPFNTVVRSGIQPRKIKLLDKVPKPMIKPTVNVEKNKRVITLDGRISNKAGTNKQADDINVIPRDDNKYRVTYKKANNKYLKTNTEKINANGTKDSDLSKCHSIRSLRSDVDNERGTTKLDKVNVNESIKTNTNTPVQIESIVISDDSDDGGNCVKKKNVGFFAVDATDDTKENTAANDLIGTDDVYNSIEDIASDGAVYILDKKVLAALGLSNDKKVTVAALELSNDKKVTVNIDSHPVKSVEKKKKKIYVDREKVRKKLELCINQLGDLECDGDVVDKQALLDCVATTLTPSQIMRIWYLINRRDITHIAEKLTSYLIHLHRLNVSYKTVFDIIYLKTIDEKIAAFNARATYEHYIKAKYKCETCLLMFKTNEIMAHHFKACHGEKPGKFACKYCPVRFYTEDKLKIHLVGHNFFYKCKFCLYSTHLRASMTNHYNTHKGVFIKCTHCSATFRSRGAFSTHLKSVHTNTHFVCQVCAVPYRSTTGLKSHLLTRHGIEAKDIPFTEDSVTCEVCGLKLVSEEVFSQHVLLSHSTSVERERLAPLPVKCRLCDESGIESQGVLQRHFRLCHPGENIEAVYSDQSLVLCHICGKGFSTRGRLTLHMRKHYNDRRYKCDLCDKSFYSTTTLRRHAMSHFPAHIPCSECDKLFKTKQKLQLHMRTHRNDRRYKCYICQKGFYTNKNMQAHIWGVHMEIRPVRKRRRAIKLMKPGDEVSTAESYLNEELQE